MRNISIKSLLTLSVVLMSVSIIYSNEASQESGVLHMIMDTVMELPVEKAFESWHYVHKKDSDYSLNSSEAIAKFEAFKENLNKIKQHNADETQTWKMTLTRYSDLTAEEFRAMFTVLNNKLEVRQKNNLGKFSYDLNGLYFMDVGLNKTNDWSEIDWTNVAGPVDYQKSCGSCFAFTFVNVLEAAISLKYNKTVRLSRQDIVDCNPLTGGCDGGNSAGAAYYAYNNGLALEQDYPYTGFQMKCKKNLNRTKYLSYLETVGHPYNADSTRKMLTNGPVYVGLDAGILQN